MWWLHLDKLHAAFFSRRINDSKLMKSCTWKLLFHVLLNWYRCVTPRLVPWNICLLFTHARPLVTVRANQRLRWKQHQTTEGPRCIFQYWVSVQRADKPEWVRWRQAITPTLGWCKETFTDGWTCELRKMLIWTQLHVQRSWTRLCVLCGLTWRIVWNTTSKISLILERIKFHCWKNILRV